MAREVQLDGMQPVWEILEEGSPQRREARRLRTKWEEQLARQRRSQAKQRATWTPEKRAEIREQKRLSAAAWWAENKHKVNPARRERCRNHALATYPATEYTLYLRAVRQLLDQILDQREDGRWFIAGIDASFATKASATRAAREVHRVYEQHGITPIPRPGGA